MSRAWMALAVAVALAGFLSEARAQAPAPEQGGWTEVHFLFCRLDAVRPRTPLEAIEELKARLLRWAGLPPPEKMEIEKVLLALESMMPHQIREFFKDVATAPEAEKAARVKEAFKRLAEGAEIPAPNIQLSAVVVIVGSQVQGGIAGTREGMPLTWSEIRPFGTVVTNVKTMWVGDQRGVRIKWLGEFLTGHTVGGVVEDGNVCKFRSPTVCDFFRRASGAPARDCWIITHGDEGSNIILDFQEFERDFQDKYKPTALNEYKLKSVDGYVQDHVMSLRKEGKTPYEILNLLPESLNPSKIHIDIDFEDPEVQRFITRIVAEHGGQITASEGFLHRLGVRLLADPVMAPRLAIFRFGGIPELRDENRQERRRSLQEKKARDHDEACVSLWRAFRSNPYYKTLGTFIVLHEYGGAIFVGPKIKVGAETGKQYFLHQLLPTLAKILGYDDLDKFIAGVKNPPRKPPIDEIFEK